MSAITAQDVIDWGSLNTGDVLAPGIIDRCLAASIDLISKRYALLPASSDDWADDAQLAAIMQAARLYKRRRSPEGVAGFGEMGVVRISRLDPDVIELLAAYQVLRINGAPDDVTTLVQSAPIATHLFAGMWRSNNNSAIADPGVGRFYTSDTTDVGQTLSISIDADDGTDLSASLATLVVGDRIVARSTQDAQIWGTFDIVSVPTDHGTWYEIDVLASKSSATPPKPNGSALYLFDFLSVVGTDTTIYLRSTDFVERHIYI